MPIISKSENLEFDIIQIGIASPNRILEWSNGEVLKPETINYRTFKPERHGLFCEVIFGPVKDWECHCGKYKRVRYRGIVCERCGVEVTTSRVRRERMGHIKLAVPVAHIWFLRSVPGYMSLLLDISGRGLEEVIYYDSYIVTEVSGKSKLKVGKILREAEYVEAREKYGETFKAETGAKAIRELLGRIDLDATAARLRRDFKTSDGQKRLKIIKRLRVIESFVQSGNRPEWMIMESLPVIPPDLRPMVQLEGGRFATSDLNDLYRRVLNRNNRLKKMINMGAPDMIIRNEKRMLQESVDVLIDNGRRKRAVVGSTGRPLRSLTDIIEGKQGRFRQNLLGKRADYSGRSVIVVGPNLKIHQCGLPKDMALELFKPFVIRKLVDRGFAQNVKSAKRMIEKGEVMVWDILEEVIKGHPVLLNRAPTLHRLGIQAFEPILVEGKAIQIHPLVCPAFNADFDGDQMAVHVPLMTEAQVEARLLMLASNNVLSPASGRPVITPTQDMVLGTYYMTADNENQKLGAGMIFSNDWEAMVAHDLDRIHLHSAVKVRRDGALVETTVGRIKFNYTINNVIAKKVSADEKFPYINTIVDKKGLEKLILKAYKQYGAAVASEIANEIKRLGFKYATIAGVSISIDDLKVPPEKKEILSRAEAEIVELEQSAREGTLSPNEAFLRSLDIWSNVTEDVTQALLKGFDKLNSVYMMAFSGARGNVQQVRQLAGIRGLMADPSGNIIPIPIRTNFKEGLSVTEYFISSYGARKGIVDTALRTADSGYLTRRLVDVSQDVMITEDECGSEDGVVLTSIREGYEEIIPLSQRLVNRAPVKNIVDPLTSKVLAKASEEIDEETAEKIREAGIERVTVRSPLTCRTKRGLCRACYGKDLSTGNIVNIGEAVGAIAAQSIGEPGTQLTMRTFHIGGVALHKTAKISIKVKHGGEAQFGEGLELKDVESETGARIKMVVRSGNIIIKIKDKKEEYFVPTGSTLLVKNKEAVKPGDIIAEYDPTYEYIIAQAPGKIKFLGLETLSRKKRIGHHVVTESIAKKDGEIFVYNPKIEKGYELQSASKVLVKVGDKVMIGDEIATGLISKTSGIVIDIKKNEILVVPGESYLVVASSRIMVEDNKTVDPYDVLAKVEAMRRDPSKTRDIIQGLPKVEELFEARRPKDAAVLCEIEGTVSMSDKEGSRLLTVYGKDEKREYVIPYEVRLKVTSGDRVHLGEQLTDGAVNPHDVLRILGAQAVQIHIVNEIQKIYRSQGVTINDKHIEVIIKQMTKKLRIVKPGDTTLLPGELIDKLALDKINEKVKGDNAEGEEVLLGITKASLTTESFISAASFQETARVLTDAAIRGKSDEMYGLKENVIIGRLIPAGTGFIGYRNLELVPTVGEMS
ncbi:DNA-directed RNA polymerase subunit beta' [Candidatus Saganbacteria bacterium]|nr:DNA-directed RNA polymerase subunit beta' [Candidatus Saganbacteria bacterium]